jgi:CDP-diacylglycerol--glycerol-3-phosphate 3-phosphatidyltransferase
MLKINDVALSESMRDVMRYIAILIFFTMVFSDVFDGYLARRDKQVTTLGGFLDPIADKLLITCACLLLASQRGHVNGFLLPPTVVVLIIGKDLFLLIAFVVFYFVTWKLYLATERLSKIGVGLQSSMVAGILIAPEVSGFLPGWIWFLRVLWWAAAGMAIVAILDYIHKGIRYIEEYEQANVSRQK